MFAEIFENQWKTGILNVRGGLRNGTFQPIWERNFVNLNFLRILVMQANLIAYEIAEVEFFQKK